MIFIKNLKRLIKRVGDSTKRGSTSSGGIVRAKRRRVVKVTTKDAFSKVWNVC